MILIVRYGNILVSNRGIKEGVREEGEREERKERGKEMEGET